MKKKTALQIIQSFCYRANIAVPPALIGSTVPSTLQLIHLLYEVSEELRAARCWIQQKRDFIFVANANTTTYALPQDFYSALLDTQWDNTLSFPMIGPVSDGDFTYRLYGVAGQSYSPIYRLFGPDTNPVTSTGQFEFNPVNLSAATTLSFEYCFSTTFFPPYWVPSQTGITVGNFRNSNGNIYVASAVTSGICGTVPPSGTTTFVDNGVTWTYSNAPYESIITDNDISIFDDDLVILGLRSKWRDSKGYDYTQSLEDYKNRIDDACNRYRGTYRGSLTRLGYWYGRWATSSPGNWNYS